MLRAIAAAKKKNDQISEQAKKDKVGGTMLIDLWVIVRRQARVNSLGEET